MTIAPEGLYIAIAEDDGTPMAMFKSTEEALEWISWWVKRTKAHTGKPMRLGLFGYTLTSEWDVPRHTTPISVDGGK